VPFLFHQKAGWHSKRVLLRDTNNLISWMVNDLICLKIQLHANFDLPNIQMAIVRPECSCPIFFMCVLLLSQLCCFRFYFMDCVRLALWLSGCQIVWLALWIVLFLSDAAITWFLFPNITFTASGY
jgi:hypothetical protein